MKQSEKITRLRGGFDPCRHVRRPVARAAFNNGGGYLYRENVYLKTRASHMTLMRLIMQQQTVLFLHERAIK